MVHCRDMRSSSALSRRLQRHLCACAPGGDGGTSRPASRIFLGRDADPGENRALRSCAGKKGRLRFREPHRSWLGVREWSHPWVRLGPAFPSSHGWRRGYLHQLRQLLGPGIRQPGPERRHRQRNSVGQPHTAAACVVCGGSGGSMRSLHQPPDPFRIFRRFPVVAKRFQDFVCRINCDPERNQGEEARECRLPDSAPPAPGHCFQRPWARWPGRSLECRSRTLGPVGTFQERRKEGLPRFRRPGDARACHGTAVPTIPRHELRAGRTAAQDVPAHRSHGAYPGCVRRPS